MKKQIIFALVALMALVGCQKKQAIDLREVSDAVLERAQKQFMEAQDVDERQAILANVVDTMYILLDENMGAPYSDTLFLEIYELLNEEQLKTLFDKMPDSMRHSEMIERVYDKLYGEKAVEIGKEYMDFRGLTPDGKEVALSSLVGKTDYVLVDFWASWCGPCRRLIPVLKDMYVRMPEGKLQIFSCSVDQEEADWRKALKEEQMPWPQVIDQLDNAGMMYEVEFIPFTVLIDREGKIVAVNPQESDLEIILLGE